MELQDARRVEVLLPMRTVLIALAALGLAAAFAAIGDTFLIVFVGIFLALVFEYPVRFVMAKTRRVARARGDDHGSRERRGRRRAHAPAARPARRVGAELPPGAADDRGGPPDGRRAFLARQLGAAENVQNGAQQISVSIPDAISGVLSVMAMGVRRAPSVTCRISSREFSGLR